MHTISGLQDSLGSLQMQRNIATLGNQQLLILLYSHKINPWSARTAVRFSRLPGLTTYPMITIHVLPLPLKCANLQHIDHACLCIHQAAVRSNPLGSIKVTTIHQGHFYRRPHGRSRTLDSTNYLEVHTNHLRPHPE
jgi:hypothetical protein